MKGLLNGKKDNILCDYPIYNIGYTYIKLENLNYLKKS